MVANGGTGVSIIDVKDKNNPIEKGYWENNKPGGSAENVLLNADDSLVFASIRYYGLVILSIADKDSAPVEISAYNSGMCEFVVLSHNE